MQGQAGQEVEGKNMRGTFLDTREEHSDLEQGADGEGFGMARSEGGPAGCDAQAGAGLPVKRGVLRAYWRLGRSTQEGSVNEEQLTLPYLEEAQQRALLGKALNNVVIASKGSDRYAEWEQLVAAGFAMKLYNEPFRVYQFSVNSKGRKFLEGDEV